MIKGIDTMGGPDSIGDLDASSWNPSDILGDVEVDKEMPLRALLLSFVALFVPVLSAVFFPNFSSDDIGLLIWLVALVPAFLLTLHRGWPGASLAMAMGMAALALTQIVLLLGGIRVTDWILLGGVILTFLSVSLGIGWLTERLHVQRRAAEHMALTDTLTGMPNRRHSVVFVEAAFAAARRGVPLTVVFFDLDKFKVYNDTHGNQAGDEALKKVAEVLRISTRQMNLTARWGGEEFLSFCSDTHLEGGKIFAERVISEIHQTFPDGSVTVSAGVAEFDKDMDSPARLLWAADEAMQRAKAAGGDCVRATSRKGEEQE